MKTLLTIFKLFILLILISTFFLIKQRQAENELEEVAQPFMKACQSLNGCMVNLESLGWIKENQCNCDCERECPQLAKKEVQPDTYYKDGMQYIGTPEKFTITKRTAKDTDTVVTGGKNISLSIVTSMED